MINLMLIIVALLAPLNLFSMNSEPSVTPVGAPTINMVQGDGWVSLPVRISSFEELFRHTATHGAGTKVYLIDLDFTLVRPFYPLVQLSSSEQENVLQEAYENYPSMQNVEHNIMQNFATYLGNLQAPNGLASAKKEILVEETMIEFMSRESAKGAIFIGFSARNLAMAEETERRLRNFGINFAELSKLGAYTKRISDIAGLRNGIYYVAEIKRKARAIAIVIQILMQDFGVQGPFQVSIVEDNPTEIEGITEYSYSHEEFNEKVFITPFFKPFDYHGALVNEFFLPWIEAYNKQDTNVVVNSI